MGSLRFSDFMNFTMKNKVIASLLRDGHVLQNILIYIYVAVPNRNPCNLQKYLATTEVQRVSFVTAFVLPPPLHQHNHTIENRKKAASSPF
jgi:hypothetical protein